MKYWIIYYEDFSNENWIIIDMACFLNEQAAYDFLNRLSDDNLWFHIKEWDTSIERIPYLKVNHD